MTPEFDTTKAHSARVYDFYLGRAVDNDPGVLAHASTLLASAPGRETAYSRGDPRDPEKILASPVVTGMLDLSRRRPHTGPLDRTV